MLRSNSFFLAVAEEQGSLRGFVAAGISRMDRKLSYRGEKALGIIHDIGVQPSCRGRGVAEMLLSAAEDWLRRVRRGDRRMRHSGGERSLAEILCKA